MLTYGGNFRHNTFDISIAPGGDDRNEGGGYLQDEIFLGDHFRWVVGGRLDKFSSIEDAVFSPRTTFMFKPAAARRSASRSTARSARRRSSTTTSTTTILRRTRCAQPGVGALRRSRFAPTAIPTSSRRR